MDIEVRDKKKEDYILQSGDIIESPNLGYGIVVRQGEHKIQALDGSGGYFDAQDSLKLLTYYANENNYKIYPKSEYKLVLERK